MCMNAHMQSHINTHVHTNYILQTHTHTHVMCIQVNSQASAKPDKTNKPYWNTTNMTWFTDWKQNQQTTNCFTAPMQKIIVDITI